MMYVRYPLSLRQVEDLLSERGIDICHETVRFWWNRFGPLFAAEIRKRRVHSRSYSQWRWHLDEVFVRINGKTHYLWRAVDHEGEVLEVYATKRRNRKAALQFLRRAMKRYGQPRVIVTDRLRSYRAAMNMIGNAADQTCGRWLNNRAENSHQPFRRREGAMSKFRDVKTLQKFASMQASIHNHFNPERHLSPHETFKQNRAAAMAEWLQLAARYSHNFDIRRLVRIRLTAPGHGIQKDGANYLVPSNAQIEVEEDLRLSTQQSPTCPCRCSPDQGAFFWSVSGRNPSISNAILTAAKHSNRTALLHWRNGNNLRPEFSSFWCL